jgi:hypothetical protein
MESIREVQQMATVLQKDVEICLEKLFPIVTTFNSGTGDPKAIAFWTRTTIRCFMGLIDGLSFSMRQAVRQCAKDAGLALTPKEQTDLKSKRLPSLVSLKLAFRTFPRLFGSDYSLDAGGEEWRGLQRIVKVRNKFTHPTVLEDLALHNALPALLPTIAWVYREIMTLFAGIEQRLGMGPLREIPNFDVPAYRESQSPWVQIFKDEDYSLIKGQGGRTLDYVKQMFFTLSDDTRAAMDVTRNAFPSHAVSVVPPMLQFAFRTYARTLSSEIEGTISAARFFIEAGVERDKVILSVADRASLEDEELEDRFAATCNLWAREFGNGYVLMKEGPNWKHLRGARAFRNRITHPKGLASFRVDLDLMETLVGAHGFFMEGWGESLYLDGDKWSEKAGGFEEMIEREETRAKEDIGSEEL